MFHLLEVNQRRFRALLVPTAGRPRWQVVEAGHGGDCLFLAARAALRQQTLDGQDLDVATLRELTSQVILGDSRFDEGIRAASEDARGDYLGACGMMRLWRRLACPAGPSERPPAALRRVRGLAAGSAPGRARARPSVGRRGGARPG